MTTPFEQLYLKLLRLNAVLATAESCTGGLIAKWITDISGSSQVFWGSVVCYDNSAKIELAQVSPEILNTHGAVSEPVALALAQGVLKKIPWKPSQAFRISLSTTGIAGPTGATPDKPVGQAWIAVGIEKLNQVPDFHTRLLQSPYAADRQKNREYFAHSALLLLNELI